MIEQHADSAVAAIAAPLKNRIASRAALATRDVVAAREEVSVDQCAAGSAEPHAVPAIASNAATKDKFASGASVAASATLERVRTVTVGNRPGTGDRVSCAAAAAAAAAAETAAIGVAAVAASTSVKGTRQEASCVSAASRRAAAAAAAAVV
jgi:hypothetical protein